MCSVAVASRPIYSEEYIFVRVYFTCDFIIKQHAGANALKIKRSRAPLRAPMLAVTQTIKARITSSRDLFYALLSTYNLKLTSTHAHVCISVFFHAKLETCTYNARSVCRFVGRNFYTVSTVSRVQKRTISFNALPASFFFFFSFPRIYVRRSVVRPSITTR